ncbi:MAG: hypothetical protein V4726_21030 [Verrucomicrobiota bacterium]
MKSRALLFSWLAVPLAAGGGFYGGHQWRGRVAAVSDAGMVSASPGSPARAEEMPFSSPPGSVKAWADRLRKCQAADLPGVFAEIMALKVPQDWKQRQRALRLLGARWAEADPAGGAAFFRKIQEAGQDSPGHLPMLAEWALRDPAAVWEHLLLLPSNEAGKLGPAVGRELLEDDPGKFWEWFEKTGIPPLADWESSGNWEAVAAAHFEALSAFAAREASGNAADPANHRKPEAVYRLLAAHLAEKDPGKALEWADALPENVRKAALGGVTDAVARRDPEKILEALALLKQRPAGSDFGDDFGAAEFLKRAVGTMGARDPLKAVEWLRSNFGKLQGIEAHYALTELSGALTAALADGRITAEQAFTAVSAASAKQGDYGNIRTSTFHQMWNGLPPDRLAAAADWLKGAASGKDRALAFKGLLPAWAAADRAAAAKFVTELNDPGVTADWWHGLVSNAREVPAINRERDARVAGAVRQVPPEHRAELLFNQMRSLYGDGMNEYSPPFDGSEMTKALEGLPPSPATDKAVTKVAEVWGNSDPESALAWASGQTDAGLREKAVGAAMESWAREDAWGASQWIDAQPAGEQRDIAAHHLARVLRTDEPESAWTWTGSISDPAIRLEAQSAVLRKWRDSSAGDARAAVEGLAADLPTADRQKLTDTLEHRDAAN